MTMLIKTIATIAASTAITTSALAQSAKDVAGATPWETITNESAPKLIVDPHLLSRSPAAAL